MPTNSYIQVPPDGAGKKLYAQQHIVGADSVQAQVIHLASALDPSHLQHVDERGQASVRFAEGSPTMDALGNLRVGQAQILGGYEYSNADQGGLFTDSVVGGGTVTFLPAQSNTTLSVGSLSGDKAVRTTNRYHFYQPGVGNLIVLTLALGDAGKAGNKRLWGYYDELNGLMFELDGSNLKVVRRSTATGTLDEEHIDRSQWNGDKLDGTGLSGMTIDVTKANFYFIDYAWLGVGVARFGVMSPDGTRWICHTFHNPNSHIGAYMGTGSLPIRYENINTTATAGTSEMKIICAAVYAEGRTDYVFWRFADIERETPVTVTTNTPVLSLRPKAEAAPGKINRTGIYPETLSVFVTGGSVKLTLVRDATLTGSTWALAGDSLAEGDIAATSYTDGTKFRTFYVPTGVTNIDLAPFYETNDEGLHRLADNSGSYSLTLSATKLDGTTVQVAATFNYRELN